MYQWRIPFILPSRQASQPTPLPAFPQPLHLFLTFPTSDIQVCRAMLLLELNFKPPLLRGIVF